MDKEILKLLLEHGIVMALIVVATILTIVAGVGAMIFYFQRKTDNGEFALEKHKAKLESERLDWAQKEQLKLTTKAEIIND